MRCLYQIPGIKSFLALVIFSFLISGCGGYRFAADYNNLPEEIKSISIPFFKNETFHPSLLLYTSTDEKTEGITITDSVLKYMTEKETDFNNDRQVDPEDKAIFTENDGNEEWCTEQLEKAFNPCEPIELICTDSDGGRDYYTKGTLTYEGVAREDVCIVEDVPGDHSVLLPADKCEGDNCFINEYVCEGPTFKKYNDFNCPNGCEDGACIEGGTEKMKIDGRYLILNENFPDDVYSSPIAFYTGVLPVGKRVRTLINFDLSGLENKQIKKAKLVINKIPMLYGEKYGIQTTELHKVTKKWSFYSANWNNPPSFDTTVVSSQEIAEDGEYTFDITPIIDYLVEHKAGVLLKAENEEETNLKKFDDAYLNVWYTEEEEETKSCEEMGGNCRFLFGCKNYETETDYKCPFWGKCCIPPENPILSGCNPEGGNETSGCSPEENEEEPEEGTE